MANGRTRGLKVQIGLLERIYYSRQKLMRGLCFIERPKGHSVYQSDKECVTEGGTRIGKKLSSSCPPKARAFA